MKISCHSCGQSIEAGEEWAGRSASCPTCQASILVPRVRTPEQTPNYFLWALRWVGVLPAALISGAVINWVFTFVNFITRPMQAPSILELIVTNVLAAALAGVAFVSAGVYVAPTAKRGTAIVLCTLLGVGGLAVMARAGNAPNTTLAFIGSLVMVGGGVYAALKTEPART